DELVVRVPEGTVVRARDGELLADLVNHGDRYVAARGGRGGRGNARFLSTASSAPSGRWSTKRVPRSRSKKASSCCARRRRGSRWCGTTTVRTAYEGA